MLLIRYMALEFCTSEVEQRWMHKATTVSGSDLHVALESTVLVIDS